MWNFPYNSVQLTEQVNRYPNLYGLMNALNLFPSQGSASRLVEIRFEDGQLSVLAATSVGGPAQTTEREDGNSIYLEIPHFAHLETIRAADIQGFLDVIAGARVPKTFDNEVAKRLRVIRNNHAITREYLRNAALKGLVKDGKGKTLHDLFKVFGINQKKIDFKLGTPETDVIAKCAELIDYMSGAMQGETMSGIEIEVSGTFMNKLVQHPKVEKYWLNTQQAGSLATSERSRLGGQWGRVFEFQTIMFRENTSVFPVRGADKKLTSEKAVADNKGHAYPIGTTNSFATYDGPANHVAEVNKPGPEVFISPKLLDHGEGVEFKSQSNCLPICKRPEFLVEVSTSN